MPVTRAFYDLYHQANAILEGGEYLESLEIFERARQLDDNQYQLHEGMGTAHFMLENYDSCIQHLTRVIELRPRHAPAYVNLGATYNRIGNYQKAIEVLRRGIGIEKRSAEGYYNLGIAYRRLNQMAMAIPAYREAIRIDPKMVTAYVNLANVFMDMKNVQQAILYFSKALDIDPTFERAKKGLANAQDAKIAAKKAVNPFGRLVEQTPDGTIANVATSNVRQDELTETERDVDRTALQTLTQRIRASGHALLAHLQEKVQPALKGFDRAIIQESSVPGSLARANAEFRPIIGTYHAHCRTLVTVVQALRKHENELNQVKR